MTDTPIAPDLLDRLRTLAQRHPHGIAQLSMDRMARELGMTRMTLYRNAGSRERILAALEASGVEIVREPPVRERVVAVAADLLRTGPIGELTLEAVAERAECSLPAIYDQFGGRQGVLKAVFERYSPLLPVEEAMGTLLEREPDLRADLAALYGTVYDRVMPEWPLLRAFVAEVLRDPESEVGQLFREWYAPRVVDALVPMLARHIARGALRPIPMPLLAQAVVGPMLLHIATHDRLVTALGGNVPDRDTAIAQFTGMACRAIAADPDTCSDERTDA